MRKFIVPIVLLGTILLVLATSVPVLANGGGGYEVKPTLGGANDNYIFTPPGRPVVNIPADNPAIGENEFYPQPGDVFWP